jgi:hypothetical protein
MLSHDTRLRCDLVDVYYTLYGSRRPVCLPIPELAGMMNMHKQDAKKSASHAAKQLATPEVKHPPAPKDTPNPIIIDDNLECMNVEVVACDDRVKVIICVVFCFVWVKGGDAGRADGHADRAPETHPQTGVFLRQLGVAAGNGTERSGGIRAGNVQEGGGFEAQV